jgi:hypothetical protein
MEEEQFMIEMKNVDGRFKARGFGRDFKEAKSHVFVFVFLD